MLSGYALANTRRIWYVPNFYVWGTPGWSEFEIIMVENIGSTKSVLYDTVSLGDGSQSVKFSDLTDFRGNNLPQNINQPKVLIKPRTKDNAFVIGEEANDLFKVARDASLDAPVKVDLFVIEMGN